MLDFLAELCREFAEVPAFAENPDYFFDWGAEERFSLLKGQKAECSAGMFDTIDIDHKTAKSSSGTKPGRRIRD